MIEAPARKFVPQDFDVKDQKQLNALIDRLKSMPTSSKSDLVALLDALSEAESVIAEQGAWIQVRLTTDTANAEYEADYNYFVTEVDPLLKQAFFELNSLIIAHPEFGELKSGNLFPYLRALEGQIEIFREENIPLESEESLLAQKFGNIAAQMSIQYRGEEYTMQQARKFLESSDATVREEVFHLVQQRRGENQTQLMDLFLELRNLRTKIAENAGFQNYRDYKFKQLGRYDYTPEDCYSFHENVKKYFLPVWERLLERRRKALGVDSLRPWDLDAPLPNENELTPFENGEDLTFKSITLFGRMDSYFADCIQTMDSMNRLDLDSRKNKAPGGYNCPMAETGVPFIFMNAASTVDDLITMMHESGHAFHSFLSHELPLYGEKEYPMEIAELASMSMELMSMDYWDTFFEKNEDLDQAKLKELERVISVLPWVATIDKFQHWIYTNPNATADELTQNWVRIYREFAPSVVDWTGMDDYVARLWQKQLHLYEVPFYYIEYGIAQVGAIELWMNYRFDPGETLSKYKDTLSRGNTMTLPELYHNAGITWGTDSSKMQKLSEFLNDLVQ